MQKQAIVNSLVADPLIVDLPIVDSLVSHAGNKQHKSSLRLSATTSATVTKQRRFKLQNFFVYKEKNAGLPMEHWLTKMKTKIKADDNFMVILDQRMAYVMSRVGDTAFGHLEPRAWNNAAQP